MAPALRLLHGYRDRQCVSAEQRQPQQHEYGNEFSGQMRHERSVAKWRGIVNRPCSRPCLRCGNNIHCQHSVSALQFVPSTNKNNGVRNGDTDYGSGARSPSVTGFFPCLDLELADRNHRDRAGGGDPEPHLRRCPANGLYRACRVRAGAGRALPAPPAGQQLHPQDFPQDTPPGFADRTGSAGRRHGVVGWRVVQRPSALEQIAGLSQTGTQRRGASLSG